VKLLPCLNHQRLPHVRAAIALYIQIVARPENDFTVASDMTMLLVLQVNRAQAPDDFTSLPRYLKTAVMTNVLLQVALRTQVDKFLATAVLQVQLVGAGGARAAATSQYAAGLVSG
jgi:hypothetical protein